MIIYKTINIINGKIYVGKQVKKNICNYYLGSGKLLGLAIKKYGRENFKKEIIERCSSNEQLNEREKFWITELNTFSPNGYNITHGGTGGKTYDKNSPNYEEIRRKKSESMKGKNRGKLNGATKPEVKEKISNTITLLHKNKNYNKTWNDSMQTVWENNKGKRNLSITQRKVISDNMKKIWKERKQKEIKNAENE